MAVCLSVSLLSIVVVSLSFVYVYVYCLLCVCVSVLSVGSLVSRAVVVVLLCVPPCVFPLVVPPFPCYVQCRALFLLRWCVGSFLLRVVVVVCRCVCIFVRICRCMCMYVRSVFVCMCICMSVSMYVSISMAKALSCFNVLWCRAVLSWFGGRQLYDSFSTL